MEELNRPCKPMLYPKEVTYDLPLAFQQCMESKRVDYQTVESSSEDQFWHDDDLLKKVYEVAESHIESRRHGNPAAKHLQGEINYLFDEKVRGEKESHILAWMVVPHMHSELEANSIWSLPPLFTEEKMSSIFNFIYHLTNDLGSVLVMKALAQRGHHLACTNVKKEPCIIQHSHKHCGLMLEMQCMDT